MGFNVADGQFIYAKDSPCIFFDPSGGSPVAIDAKTSKRIQKIVEQRADLPKNIKMKDSEKHQAIVNASPKELAGMIPAEGEGKINLPSYQVGSVTIKFRSYLRYDPAGGNSTTLGPAEPVGNEITHPISSTFIANAPFIQTHTDNVSKEFQSFGQSALDNDAVDKVIHRARAGNYAIPAAHEVLHTRLIADEILASEYGIERSSIGQEFAQRELMAFMHKGIEQPRKELERVLRGLKGADADLVNSTVRFLIQEQFVGQRINGAGNQVIANAYFNGVLRRLGAYEVHKEEESAQRTKAKNDYMAAATAFFDAIDKAVAAKKSK